MAVRETVIWVPLIGWDKGTDSGHTLRKFIDSQIDRELDTSDEIDARFDSVHLAMLTVASLEDAEKLFKSVSEL